MEEFDNLTEEASEFQDVSGEPTPEKPLRFQVLSADAFANRPPPTWIIKHVLPKAELVVLFGARDVWFVVGVPVFLYASGWSRPMVGGFLAIWTIGYGVVQAFAPRLVRRSDDGLSAEVPAARLWSAMLAVVTIALAIAVALDVPRLEWVVVGGLGIFGFAFAVNSSIHSYLVLAYAGSEKAAEDVGFYYAANAAGRFAGTLLSGVLYQWGGLLYALLGSAAMLIACWVVTLALPVTKPLPRTSG